jgi:hypothetical protein
VSKRTSRPTVEQVARIGARLLLQTALEAEVSERRIDSSQREDLSVRALHRS